MTPGNIVGMAYIKGLDVIALTDHNSCKNCPAVMELARQYGLIAIPGMELCTSEEVHGVCLFETLEGAMKFDAYVSERLLDFDNDEAIFGRQSIRNEKDEEIGTERKLLLNSADISFEGLWELVESFGGVMFPAHMDKSSNSLLSNLGFVPPNSRFTCAEIREKEKTHTLLTQNPYLTRCRILYNSDAHYLGEIQEREYALPVSSRSVKGVLEALKRGR